MASDRSDTEGPSRRDFLRATGAGVLATSLAGCDELPDEANETSDGGTGTGGGAGTATGTPGGTTTGPGDGGTENPLVANPYAVDPEFAVEREDLVRSTFAEMYHTELTEIPGVDAPADASLTGHAMTYGHDVPGAEDPSAAAALRRLSAGVLSLPAPDGANALADVPLSELVARREENLLLSAVGLGPTVEWLGDPVPIEGGPEEAPRNGTVRVELRGEQREVEVRTFVGAVRAEPGPGMPGGGEGDGYLDGGAVPGEFMMTLHVGRTMVGGDLVMTGMASGWPRPPGYIDPPPSDMDEDVKGLLSDVYEKVVKAALFVDVLGEKGMLAAALMPDEEELERRRPNEELVERSYSVTLGLDDEDQIELGYPTENVDDGHTYNSFTVGRDMPGLFSQEDYDPEKHSVGTSYLVKLDTRITTYPLGTSDGRTIPFGVVASPLAEVEGEERNELATEPLPDTFGFPEEGWDAMALATDLGDFSLSTNSRIEQLSGQRLLRESGTFEGYRVDLSSRSGRGIDATSGTLYMGRVTTRDEVVIAFAFSKDGGNDHFDDSESVSTLFQEAVDRVIFDPDTPSNWVDASIDDANAVQICRNTRLETGAGDVLGQSDPTLVEGRNTAVPFDASTWRGTAVSGYPHPLHGVFTFEVGDRPATFQTVLGQSTLDDLDADNVDPDVLFDGNRQDSDPDNDLPVFELQSGDDSITLEARAPSGHRYDTTTLSAGSEFDKASFETLRVGFITIVDPERGANYGDGNGEPVSYQDTVEAAFEYLKRTYPAGIAAYRHDAAIEGVKDVLGNATNNTTKDYRNARVGLERVAKPGNNNWSYSGTTMAHGISESDARSQIRSNGFDVWVLVPPNGYYQFHRDGRPSGLAPWNDDLAVTAIEGDRNGRARAAETVAQEIGHRIEQSPYQSPTSSSSNGANPLAQRDDDGTNTANRDFDHARHLGSNNDGNTPSDPPGVVSRAYSLADGEFVVPNWVRWNNGGFDIQSISNFPGLTSGYGPNNDGSRLGRLESYMSYSGRAVWADSLITEDVVESNFKRESGNFQTNNVVFGGLNQVNLSLSGSGAVPGAASVEGPSLSGLTATEARVRGPDEERLAAADAIVSVAMLGPDGTPVAETQATARGGVYGHEVEDERLLGDTPFAVEFPEDAVEMVVEAPSGTLTENPITRPLRDAVFVNRSDVFQDDVEAVRERLRAVLEDVRMRMDEGDFAGARDALAAYADRTLPELLDPEFEPRANEYDRQRLGALFEEMIGRLDGLAGDEETTGEIKMGEAPGWTDWVPTPESLPGFAESGGFWQYSIDAILTGGDFESKAAIEDPMANPLVVGQLAQALWFQLQESGLGEAVLGDAVVSRDVDPSQVPAETGLLLGNVAVYLGSFDVARLDELVDQEAFSESDVAGVYVHDESATYFAYGAGYVVLGSTPEEVRTLLQTGAGDVDRWKDVDEEVAWLFGAGARGDFTLVVHTEDSTISPEEGGELLDLAPFDAASGLAQSASLDGETFTNATTGVVYPPETSPELDRLRETLGGDGNDVVYAQDGRFVQVRASYDGPLEE